MVFPQIVKELDALQARRSADDGTWDAQVIAAGESYKVCRDAREVTRMISDPHYTVMPSSFFDVLVTDTGEFRPRDHSHVTMRACVSHVEAAADECLAAVLARYPAAVPGADNYCRISDRTLEVAGGVDPAEVARIAAAHGLSHTFSTVHHHLSRSSLNKQTGLLLALARHASPGIDPAAQVVTVGDSVNDDLLFEPGAFAATFGVRGVLRAIAGSGMRAPDYVALADGGAGFDEIGALLVRAR